MRESTDNTEGSLTEEQKQILIGVLLGDGSMRKKTHALLEINHSFKQKDYVDWWGCPDLHRFHQWPQFLEDVVDAGDQPGTIS